MDAGLINRKRPSSSEFFQTAVSDHATVHTVQWICFERDHAELPTNWRSYFGGPGWEAESLAHSHHLNCRGRSSKRSLFRSQLLQEADRLPKSRRAPGSPDLRKDRSFRDHPVAHPEGLFGYHCESVMKETLTVHLQLLHGRDPERCLQTPLHRSVVLNNKETFTMKLAQTVDSIGCLTRPLFLPPPARVRLLDSRKSSGTLKAFSEFLFSLS